MFWFIAAAFINCFAILLLIVNAVYNAFVLEQHPTNFALPNLIGLGLAIVVAVAFGLKSSGNLPGAKILLWLPAAPLSVLFAFWLLYIIVVLITGKPDWR